MNGLKKTCSKVLKMIEKYSLEDSETFELVYKNRNWGINASSMLKMDGIEIYYSKEDEIVYIMI